MSLKLSLSAPGLKASTRVVAACHESEQGSGSFAKEASAELAEKLEVAPPGQRPLLMKSMARVGSVAAARCFVAAIRAQRFFEPDYGHDCGAWNHTVSAC